MYCEILLRLLLAHFIGDFLVQTQKWCNLKLKYGVRCKQFYLHSLIIFLLSWIALWSIYAWWIAIIIGGTHMLIDAFKRKDGLWSFSIDQILHIISLILITHITATLFRNGMPYYKIPDKVNIILLFALAFLINGKPANILIKHVLDAYSVGNQKKRNGKKDEIQSGKLIGNIERWLIIIFISCNQYEAIGFLVAAKSIIRYKEGETGKTEYVLAGTLFSVFIAVISGILLKSIYDGTIM